MLTNIIAKIILDSQKTSGTSHPPIVTVYTIKLIVYILLNYIVYIELIYIHFMALRLEHIRKKKPRNRLANGFFIVIFVLTLRGLQRDILFHYQHSTRMAGVTCPRDGERDCQRIDEWSYHTDNPCPTRRRYFNNKVGILIIGIHLHKHIIYITNYSLMYIDVQIYSEVPPNGHAYVELPVSGLLRIHICPLSYIIIYDVCATLFIFPKLGWCNAVQL